MLFAERVEQEVLEKVPIRQYVVTIPKMLRIFFKYDRKLLGLLSRCFYQTLKQFLQAVPRKTSRSRNDRIDSELR